MSRGQLDTLQEPQGDDPSQGNRTDSPEPKEHVRVLQDGGYAVMERGEFHYFAPSDPVATRVSDPDQEDIEETSLKQSSIPQQRESVSLLKQWEGVVSSLDDDGIVNVRLFSGPADQEALSDFPIEEVSLPDQSLVRPGAVFYWAIAYRYWSNGQRTRESSIRFRRLPARRQEDWEEARQWARETMIGLGLQDSSDVDEA